MSNLWNKSILNFPPWMSNIDYRYLKTEEVWTQSVPFCVNVSPLLLRKCKHHRKSYETHRNKWTWKDGFTTIFVQVQEWSGCHRRYSHFCTHHVQLQQESSVHQSSSQHWSSTWSSSLCCRHCWTQHVFQSRQRHFCQSSSSFIS